MGHDYGIIEKYGVVPQSVMPETVNSSNSTEINDMLNLKLRKDAVELREMVAANARMTTLPPARKRC